jgi:hypothetical protein
VDADAVAALDVHTLAVRGCRLDLRAEPAEHALGVVARQRAALDDARVPVRAESGEEDARLDLRAGDRRLVLDGLQRSPAFDTQRRMAVERRQTRAHQFERLDDAAHRAAAQGLVAGEHGGEGLRGEHAGEQSHRRSGVAAVEWA